MDKAILRRYLLYKLPEPEQTNLEERFFAEDAEFQQLAIAEDELIDEYVRNELARHDRQRFEKYFLDSPRRIERVRLAQALIARTSSIAKEAEVSRWRWIPSIITIIRNRNPQLTAQFAFAAVPLVIVFGFVSILVSWNIARTAIARSQQQQEQMWQSELRGRDIRLAQLADELRSEQSRRSALENDLSSLRARSQQGAAGQSTPTFLSFVLTPGLARAAGETQRFVLRPGLYPVQLQLDVRPTRISGIGAQADERYRAVLRNAQGHEIWSQYLTRDSAANSHLVSVTLPSRVLEPGDYSLTLSRAAGDGPFAEVEDYVFSISRR